MSGGIHEPEHRLALRGARILIVEDEYYIADELSRVVSDAGARVIGPCSTLGKAMDAVAADNFDCAVVDLNLHGESAAPVVDALIAEGKSFAIATGYGDSAVPAHLKQAPRIEKPFDPPAIVQMLVQLSCAGV